MEVYSLFELNQYIKQVVALNFVDSLWISCEISQINLSRGHCYLNLVEKDDGTDQVKAMMSAVIWYRDYAFIQRKLGAIAEKVLQDGMMVKLKVELDFHERYGLKLLIKDIDPSYTYGQLAIQREKIIEQLNKEGRMHLNDGLPFPTVIQKCAIISSDTAAGYQDLQSHLTNNPYGFAFQCDLFPAAMQGQRTEMEVVAQLRDINELGIYQAVIITRGGGSKLDLSAFDSYAIAKQISEMSIPVISGIGHDIDMSIADMVSAISLKTPTAVANFMIDHNASFETLLYDAAVDIKISTQARFKRLNVFLEQLPNYMSSAISNRILVRKERINRIESELRGQATQRLQQKMRSLDHIEEVIALLNPLNLLAKGYSMTMKKGKLIDSIKKLKKGDVITSRFKDGDIESTIN